VVWSPPVVAHLGLSQGRVTLLKGGGKTKGGTLEMTGATLVLVGKRRPVRSQVTQGKQYSVNWPSPKKKGGHDRRKEILWWGPGAGKVFATKKSKTTRENSADGSRVHRRANDPQGEVLRKAGG